MREKTRNNFPASAVCMAFINEIPKDEHLDTTQGKPIQISGLLYYSSAHMLYPVFSRDMIHKLRDTSDRYFSEFRNYITSFEGVIGRSSDVQIMEEYLPHARVKIAYDFMIQTNNTAYSTSVPLDTNMELEVRKATNDDLQELIAIEAAYQKEEVLTPIHEFNLAVCRANQQFALLHVPVYVALYKDKIIARAQINGSGSTYEQIGGVFVYPEFRRLHAGSAVMAALMNDIHKRGKIPCLYVKKTNIPAIQLYKKLGFSTVDDFSIIYQ